MKARFSSARLGLRRGGNTSAQLFIISSGFFAWPREGAQVNWPGFTAPSGVSWIHEPKAYMSQGWRPLTGSCVNTTTLCCERIIAPSVGSSWPGRSTARWLKRRARLNCSSNELSET